MKWITFDEGAAMARLAEVNAPVMEALAADSERRFDAEDDSIFGPVDTVEHRGTILSRPRLTTGHRAQK